MRGSSACAYRGGTLPYLFIALHVGAFAALVAMLVRPSFRGAFERRCVGPMTAVDLGFVRVVVCTILVAYVLTEDLPGYAEFDGAWYRPPGYLGGLDRAPLS